MPGTQTCSKSDHCRKKNELELHFSSPTFILGTLFWSTFPENDWCNSLLILSCPKAPVDFPQVFVAASLLRCIEQYNWRHLSSLNLPPAKEEACASWNYPACGLTPCLLSWANSSVFCKWPHWASQPFAPLSLLCWDAVIGGGLCDAALGHFRRLGLFTSIGPSSWTLLVYSFFPAPRW